MCRHGLKEKQSMTYQLSLVYSSAEAAYAEKARPVRMMRAEEARILYKKIQCSV